MDRAELVPICTVTNPMEAEIIRAALESAGITCQIGGESQGGFAGVLKIDVLTPASSVRKARRYLRKLKLIVRQDRKKSRDESKAAKKQGEMNEGIQELNPGTNIKEPPENPASSS